MGYILSVCTKEKDDKCPEALVAPPPVEHRVAQPSVENYSTCFCGCPIDVECGLLLSMCRYIHVSLHSKGPYNCVQLVNDMYYLAGAYMHCSKCSGSFASWDHRLLSLLFDGVRAWYSVVLTYKYPCDWAPGLPPASPYYLKQSYVLHLRTAEAAVVLYTCISVTVSGIKMVCRSWDCTHQIISQQLQFTAFPHPSGSLQYM